MEKRKNSGLGIAGMILGIVSVLFACVFFGGLTSIVGLILSIIAIAESNRKKGFSITGIILNSIALLIFIFLIIVINNDSDEADLAKNTTEQTVIDNSVTTPVPAETPEPISTETPTPSTTPSPTPTPEPTLSPEEIEEEYKASCQEYKYKDVLRNPEDYIGQRIVIEIEISSVHSEDLITPIKYYFGYSKDEPDDTYYYGDRYAIFDFRQDKDLKLLEDDVIIVWGEISSPQETESWIVNSEEIFCIDMKYVELIGE